MAATQKLRGRDYVSTAEHEEVAGQLSAAKEQLVETLEELSARERELSEVRTVSNASWQIPGTGCFVIIAAVAAVLDGLGDEPQCCSACQASFLASQTSWPFALTADPLHTPGQRCLDALPGSDATDG